MFLFYETVSEVVQGYFFQMCIGVRIRPDRFPVCGSRENLQPALKECGIVLKGYGKIFLSFMPYSNLRQFQLGISMCF